MKTGASKKTDEEKTKSESKSNFRVSPLAALVPAKEASKESDAATWAVHIGFTEEAMSRVRIELKVKGMKGSSGSDAPRFESDARFLDVVLRAVCLRAHNPQEGSVNCVVSEEAIVEECKKEGGWEL